jgi:ABC-type antimicrobial peptide transport system permease subunit
METEATLNVALYKNTTAYTVTIALTKKYINISKIAGRERGTVTRRKVFHLGIFILSPTLSNSLSNFLRQLVAVRNGTEK